MSSLDVAEERISKLGNKLTETFQTKMQRKKNRISEKRICDDIYEIITQSITPKSSKIWKVKIYDG